MQMLPLWCEKCQINTMSRHRWHKVMCGLQVAYKITQMHVHITVRFSSIKTHFSVAWALRRRRMIKSWGRFVAVNWVWSVSVSECVYTPDTSIVTLWWGWGWGWGSPSSSASSLSQCHPNQNDRSRHTATGPRKFPIPSPPIHQSVCVDIFFLPFVTLFISQSRSLCLTFLHTSINADLCVCTVKSVFVDGYSCMLFFPNKSNHNYLSVQH